MTIWQTTRFDIDLSQPRIMGIVNVTPDSFSDGGQYLSAQAALQQCERLVREGADILDIGGESSRPGAPTLSPEEEWARLAEVLKVAVSLGVPVSVDTCKTEVMRRALDVGVDIINDIRAHRCCFSLTNLQPPRPSTRLKSLRRRAPAQCELPC